MSFRKIVMPLVPGPLKKRFNRRSVQRGYDRFRFNYNDISEVKADIQRKYQHNSELLELIVTNNENSIMKWHHYIPLYDRYFSPFRGQKIRFLEIGVDKGGSLQVWRKYFGNDAIIFGIDINPKCEKLNGIAGQIRIGSQTDRRFLELVIKEMGGVDIVLDDGSHHMEHISTTLKYLFPHMSYGGIYMIEDLHTAFWEGYGGGYSAHNNFFRFLNDLADDMHHWYHLKGLKQAVISQECSGIHIHDSMAVLEKNKIYEPVYSKIP